MMKLLVLAMLALAQQPEQLATVEGKVLDSATNQPLAGVKVILARTDRGPVMFSMQVFQTEPGAGEQDPKAERLAVLTGSDGVFRFRVEGTAKFNLYAERSGYLRHMNPREAHEARPGEKTEIVIRLTPELTISGRLTDDHTRERVRGLAVMPYQYRVMGVTKGLLPVGGGATTDENGRFKIERLSPGEYYLEVRPPLGSKITTEPKPVEDFKHAVQLTYARSWYPGVATVEEAAPVRLLPGSSLEGVDIRIAKRRTAAVRGRVLADVPVSPAREISLALHGVARTINAGLYMIIAAAKVKAGSAFEIDRLSPGTYSLTATTIGGTRAEKLAATLVLRVGEENQEGLDLYLRKGATIAGRVRVQDRDEPGLPAEGLRVDVRPLVRAKSVDELPVPVRSADGSFTIEGVMADRYQVTTSKLPQGYAISEVRYNRALARYGVFEIDAGADAHQLEITLAAANGSVQATVTDGSRPSAGAAVLLVPEPVDDEAIALAMRRAKADKDGRATIAELLPGTYRVAAYPEGVLWGDDANLKQRLANGEEARVARNQTVLVQVRVQPVP